MASSLAAMENDPTVNPAQLLLAHLKARNLCDMSSLVRLRAMHVATIKHLSVITHDEFVKVSKESHGHL